MLLPIFRPLCCVTLLSRRISKPLLLFLSIAITIEAYSQHEIKITPPAPEATSIFKFQEVPVSTYTGLANTTVPLYTINLKRMSIPVNVSYHARGVKVDEIASRVGIGWALNYGGLISRQIRGKADDSGLGYLYGHYYNEVFTDINKQSSMMNDIITGDLDEYPDLFFFDMVGQGGKFTFDQISKNVVQQKFSDNKITPMFSSEGQIDGWVIVDAEGNTFYYGFSEDKTRKAVDYDQVSENYIFKRNTGNVLITQSNEERAITSWHLMEIKTAFGERVQFIYESPSEAELCISYRHSYDKKMGSDVHSFFSKILSHQPQLKEIFFDSGKIKFIKSRDNREDLKGGHVLDLVQVVNSSDILLKEYAFQYYYTTSPDNNNQLAYLKKAEPESSKRLFLQSIQERGQSGSVIPPYFFEYNTIILPNRFSTSQDNWGYFNGGNNGEYLTFFNYAGTAIDRKVDILKSEAGLLKKVTYPTGAHVLFEYEHNFAIPPNFISDLLIAETNPSPTNRRLEGFLKHPKYLNDKGTYVDTFKIGKIVGTAKFSIDVFNGFIGSGVENGVYDDDQREEANCHCRVFLHGDNKNLMLYPSQETRLLSLNPGEYVFEVVPLLKEGDPFYIKLQWDEYPDPAEEPEPTEPDPMYAAGKRIKRITYVNSNKTTLIKEYRYLKPSGKTSGNIFGLPNFYSIQSTAGDWPMTDKYGSMPGSPLTTLQGNSVGYSYVTEYTMDPNNKSIGRTEYEFTVTEDGGQYFKFPFHLPIDNEWLRGKNRATRIFENDDLRKTIENHYLYSNKIFPADFIFKPADVYKYSITNTLSYLPLLVFTGYNPVPGTGYSFTTYYIMGGTCDLRSTIESYYENGQRTFSQTKKYYYNYNHHYQLQSTESISSDGSHTFTYTTYASDYANGTPFIDAMKAKNLLSYPIEQVTYKDNAGIKSIVSGNITYYKTSIPALADSIHVLEFSNPIPLSNFKFSNGTLGQLPSNTSLIAFSSDANYKSQVNFNNYDTKGNVLQMTSNGQNITSYLWDYSNTLAIARVNGAQQTDIAYTSFEAEAKGNWSFNGISSIDDTSPAGSKTYSLTGGALTKNELSSSEKYILTYWVKSSTPVTATGSTGSSVSQHVVMDNINGWSQFRCEVSNTIQLTLSGTVSIDEVRLHPADAEMTTFCYNPLTGMTSSADSNGTLTYYKYDLLNRLQAIKDQKGNIIKFFQYHYSQQP